MNNAFSQNQFNNGWNGNMSNQPTGPLGNLASQYSQATQAVQRQPQISVMPGRMVTNEGEIKASEVPMDGSISLFLQNDLSRIYAKAWNGNGGIDTVRYILEPPPTPPKSSEDDFQKEIFNRLDKIEAAIASNSGSRPNHYNKNRNNRSGPKPNNTGGDQK